jgi:hypothetical protein
MSEKLAVIEHWVNYKKRELCSHVIATDSFCTRHRSGFIQERARELAAFAAGIELKIKH